MILDTALLNTQHYKVRINPEKGVASSLHLSVIAIENGAFRSLNYGHQLYFIYIFCVIS